MAMDRLRLIAEVYKRPALWDGNYRRDKKLHMSLPEIWDEVAASMGPDVSVDDCKMKWQNLRSAYWHQIRRIKKFIEHDKHQGIYDHKKVYKSKWDCFEHMQFLRQSGSSNESYEDDDESQNYSEKHIVNIRKLEAESETKSEVPVYSVNEEYGNNQIEKHIGKGIQKLQHAPPEDISQTSSATKFNCSAKSSSQAQEDTDDNATSCSYDHIQYSENLKKEENLTISNKILDMKRSNDLIYGRDSDYNFLVSCMAQMTMMDILQNLQFRAEMTDLILNMLSSFMSKYPKESYDQMHYSENDKKREQTIIESGILGIKRFNNSVYAAESDYHFLVSCLPQMKAMNNLQNLQFRAKITKLLFSMLSASMSKNSATISSS